MTDHDNRSSTRISRRSLVRDLSLGLASAVVATESRATSAGVGAEPTLNWTREVDVIVVGSGAAAFSAAVTARHQGASVLMLEKASIAGGTTARSGGGAWLPNNPDLRAAGTPDDRTEAIRYMARASFPNLYTATHATFGLPQHQYDLIAAFFDNASPAIEQLISLQALQLEGNKPLADLYLPPIEGSSFGFQPKRTLYAKPLPGALPAPGAEWIRQLKLWTDANAVELRVRHAVTAIHLNRKGEAVGVQVSQRDGTLLHFRARKGIVFGCGGFTNNQELMLAYQLPGVYGGCGVPSNQGDLIQMAGAIGAKLGNMGGAFRMEVVVDQALEYSSLLTDVWQPTGDSMIYVNKYGVRTVNEKRPYHERARVHFAYDSTRGEYPNQILVMLWDRRTAELYGGASSYPVPAGGADAPHVVTGGTLDELTENLRTHIKQLNTRVGPVANLGFWDLSADFSSSLAKTLVRFNHFAHTGIDEDFGRGSSPYDRDWHSGQFSIPVDTRKWNPNEARNTMARFQAKGPYYACLIGAGNLDTNGGPVVDSSARVLHVTGRPIPGLYGAGNCIAAPSAGTYWGGGGTLGPALTFGYIAGKNVVNEPVHDASALLEL